MGEHDQLQLPKREARPAGCLDQVRVLNEFGCCLEVDEYSGRVTARVSVILSPSRLQPSRQLRRFPTNGAPE
eukprot:8130334-Pyramimonas_sp.AAC.1